MKKDYLFYKSNKKPFSIWDLVVLGVVILLVVVLLLVLFLPKDAPNYINVYREGKLVKKVKIQDINNPIVFETNGIRVLMESDGVTVIASDCDDHACEKIGKITKKGEAIVCVPKTITVSLS